jgi:isochorismate hydrolase
MWSPAIAASVPQDAVVTLLGLEAHICITQTALHALHAGRTVYVLADGVSSCNRAEVSIALARLRAAGAVVTTSESWLYEVMGDASIPEFRKITALVKETSQDTQATLKSLLEPKM